MQPTKAVGVPVSLWLTCSLAWGVSLYMGGCAADPVGTETGSGMAPETAKSETGKSETGQTPGKAEDPMKVAQMPLPSGMVVKKGSKTRSWISGGMPPPESWMRISTLLPSRLDCIVIFPRPFLPSFREPSMACAPLTIIFRKTWLISEA